MRTYEVYGVVDKVSDFYRALWKNYTKSDATLQKRSKLIEDGCKAQVLLVDEWHAYKNHCKNQTNLPALLEYQKLKRGKAKKLKISSNPSMSCIFAAIKKCMNLCESALFSEIAYQNFKEKDEKNKTSITSGVS